MYKELRDPRRPLIFEVTDGPIRGVFVVTSQSGDAAAAIKSGARPGIAILLPGIADLAAQHTRRTSKPRSQP